MEDKQPNKDQPSDDLKKKFDEAESDGHFDKDGNMYIKLTLEDSALVVRADGSVEMISHDLEKAEGGYVGDVEDLNKTFSLVLALATALENEDLYNRIYHNLNMVLMAKWEQIPEDIKQDIIQKRRNTAINRTDEERKEKMRRVEEFRDRMSKYKDDFIEEERRKLAEDMQREAEFLDNVKDEFADPQEIQNHMEDMLRNQRPEKKIRKAQRNPLYRMRNVDWNPYDETLITKKGKWRLDHPPDLDEDE